MEIRPILGALSRTKIAVFLIILQIAITLAVITNAISIVNKNQSDMDRPTGVDLDNTFIVSISTVNTQIDSKEIMQSELAKISATPGVTAVSPSPVVPLSGNNWCGDLNTAPKGEDGTDVNMCIYHGDENFSRVYDFKIIEGRNFLPEEIAYVKAGEDVHIPYIMVSKAVADEMFPEVSAVGKSVYDGGDTEQHPKIIVGVFDQLISGSPQHSNPFKMRIDGRVRWQHNTNYSIRTAPGELPVVMEKVEKLLKQDPNRYVSKVRSMQEYKKIAYELESGVNSMLNTIVTMLTFINILGVVSLAWFNVNKRRKQIGTRRALGARKGDIVKYFLTENWLITSMGIVLGIAIALALNYLLDQSLEVGKMQPQILVFGAVLLWVIGLVAVYIPDVRASSISPATATRSV